MTHILSTRPLGHYRLRVVQAGAATADVPAALARPALSFAATVAAIVLVAIDLRPGIVSIGPLLPHIRQEFGMSNAEASLRHQRHDLPHTEGDRRVDPQRTGDLHPFRCRQRIRLGKFGKDAFGAFESFRCRRG